MNTPRGPVENPPSVLRRAARVPPTMLAVAGALTVLALLTGAGRAPIAQHGPEDAVAARAVAGLTGPSPGTARLPADLRAVVGNAVERVDGRPVVAGGGCSTPVELPAAFRDACRAHDLGYDLLRYAAARGAPLGPWARRAVDERFARDLAVACDGTAGRDLGERRCRLLAHAADITVGANSWRQGDGVPVPESSGRVVGSTAVTVAAVMAGITG